MRRRAKIAAAIMALLLVVAACGGDDDGDDTGTTVAAGADSTEGATDETEAPSAPEGDPIVVGSTLSLTGPFGPTGIIHKIADDLYVERLNAAGGLMGSPSNGWCSTTSPSWRT